MSYICDITLYVFFFANDIKKEEIGLVPNKAGAEHLCVSEQHSEWICLWMNHLNQWFNNPFIKTAICFVTNWISHFEWIMNHPFNEELIKTRTCCHLLVVSVMSRASKGTSIKTH